MIININDISINYIDYGNKEGKSIVLLHGWGQNIEMMKPLGDLFSNEYRIIIVDLPGYGKSPEPPFPWSVNDYVLIIKEFLDNLKIENPIFIGHSFGGKIGLLYASKYSLNKLIVLGSPFKQNIKKVSLKLKFLKFLKKVPIINNFEEYAKKRIGSTDYCNATPMMRKILVNTVNLDITEDVKNIKCPTLIIWGRDDQEVSVEDAHELEQLIENSGLVIIDNGTHYAYLEHLKYVFKVINSLLKE